MTSPPRPISSVADRHDGAASSVRWEDRLMDEAGFRALLQPEGIALLESLPPYDETSALAVAARARREGHDSTLVAAALTQARLRARAVAKFGPWAARMFFTQEGLEQATRAAVADRHAQ